MNDVASSPRIEPARADHLPAVARLADVIWRRCYREILSKEQMDYMLNWMYAPEVLQRELKEGIRFDRLLIEDQFIGFVSYGPHPPPGTFKLHKLYLHPDWHGRGLGSLLLRHSENSARQLGANRMILNVNKQNRHALRTYERNGYAIVESVTVDIGKGFVMDDFIMAKALNG
ncbi:MAG TPA: GNAT family N-acetyltransferase [Verrucomicrobia bacterium]|nr:GNAT family N-acetyltransferase [Verrucomicrobiota bacterium]HOP96006.1 GNAT family N-acetyltransferase [Verrucomicrobiota bacterium]HPU56768.1 GNAT family N-acetyltransferase [Verrucomicrobiota bacterium]